MSTDVVMLEEATLRARVKISREATYIDEDGGVHSAFQENLVLLLAEAYYGFVLGDSEAFVRYVATAGAS